MLDHSYFGQLRFMRGGYREGELVVDGLPEKIGLVVPAVVRRGHGDGDAGRRTASTTLPEFALMTAASGP